MDLINRIWNWINYALSFAMTSVGVMTQKDWLTVGGVAIAIITAILGEIHRRRMANAQVENNRLISQLVDVVRTGDNESRQEIRELIQTIKAGQK